MRSGGRGGGVQGNGLEKGDRRAKVGSWRRAGGRSGVITHPELLEGVGFTGGLTEQGHEIDPVALGLQVGHQARRLLHLLGGWRGRGMRRGVSVVARCNFSRDARARAARRGARSGGERSTRARRVGPRESLGTMRRRSGGARVPRLARGGSRGRRSGLGVQLFAPILQVTHRFQRRCRRPASRRGWSRTSRRCPGAEMVRISRAGPRSTATIHAALSASGAFWRRWSREG